MNALVTLVPVVLMIFLGFVSRRMQWITMEQKNGANKLIFSVLFPIMIFHVLFTSSIDASAIPMILFVLVAWIILWFVGRLLSGWTGKEYAHISPYLITCVEGGNVALPLYLSIVGSAYAINTVTFDIAGTILTFIVVPIVVTKSIAGNVSAKQLTKQVLTSPFILAVLIGLGCNFLGLYRLLSETVFLEVYTASMDMVTSPIVAVILFCIGYDFSLEKEAIGPLLKLMILKFVGAVIIQVGLLTLFTVTKEMKIAILLYFMCPTGFGTPIVISPLYHSEKDSSFVSSFISMYMIITLIVYTCLVIFM